MQCITFLGKVEHISLLTHSDKVKMLEKQLSHNRKSNTLFLPDELFYGEYVSAEDPERMADVLFKWMGIKHRSVHFHIDPEQIPLLKYSHEKNASQISLSLAVLEDPFLCAAVIAHGIIHHLLIARAKVSFGNEEEDEALTDIGTIYAGFGVIVLNGFSTGRQVLGTMGEQNYSAEFLDYCTEQRIVKNVWEPYVVPATANRLLSSKSNSGNIRPYLRLRLKKARKHKQKLILYIAVAFVLVLSAGILLMNRPKKLSTEMLDRKESIAVLKSQYEQCQKLVEYKSERWDNSDIFIQRQIEADKTRCSSLKNRYNYEVSSFNSEL